MRTATCHIALSVLFALPHSLDAQVIQGVVLDAATSRTIADASVVLLDKNGKIRRGTLTEPDGTYSLVAPEAGKYTLRVGGYGYTSSDSAPVELEEGQTLEMTLRISKEGAAPAGFEAFYQRKARGEGVFLTEEEIRSRGGSRFTDLLRNTAGVVVIPLPADTGLGGGREYQTPREREPSGYFTVRLAGSHSGAEDAGARQAGESTSDCPPVLYVDGKWWGSIDKASEYGPDFRLLPEDVTGIEIYTRSVVPTEFDTGLDAKCGVIVVWRKQSR